MHMEKLTRIPVNYVAVFLARKMLRNSKEEEGLLVLVLGVKIGI